MSSIKDLSAGAVERVVNKATAAAFFDVSVPSVDGWLRRGCPFIQRGGMGKAWKLDLLDMAKWRYGNTGGTDQEDPEKLPPKERLDWYRGDRERTKHMEESGELIPAATFEAELASVLKVVAVTIESLPDVLERDAGIDGAAVERTQAIADRIRDELYRKLIELEPSHAV